MLNIGLDFELKRPTMPFYFDGKNECVHCGGKNSLVFIDKFGKPASREVKAFDHIVCSKCQRVYSILWKKEENSTKMYPSAVEMNISQDFNNIINSTIRRNGDNKF